MVHMFIIHFIKTHGVYCLNLWNPRKGFRCDMGSSCGWAVLAILLKSLLTFAVPFFLWRLRIKCHGNPAGHRCWSDIWAPSSGMVVHRQFLGLMHLTFFLLPVFNIRSCLCIPPVSSHQRLEECVMCIAQAVKSFFSFAQAPESPMEHWKDWCDEASSARSVCLRTYSTNSHHLVGRAWAKAVLPLGNTGWTKVVDGTTGAKFLGWIHRIAAKAFKKNNLSSLRTSEAEKLRPDITTSWCFLPPWNNAVFTKSCLMSFRGWLLSDLLLNKFKLWLKQRRPKVLSLCIPKDT